LSNNITPIRAIARYVSGSDQRRIHNFQCERDSQRFHQVSPRVSLPRARNAKSTWIPSGPLNDAE
jgi:hypothetical protein